MSTSCPFLYTQMPSPPTLVPFHAIASILYSPTVLLTRSSSLGSSVTVRCDDSDCGVLDETDSTVASLYSIF